MLKKTIFFYISTFFIALTTSSQIVVTNTQTPAQLVQDVLLGSGVAVSNITINGSAVNINTLNPQMGGFTIGNTTFPFTDGIVLSTGNAVDIPGNASLFVNGQINNDSDPDLADIANDVINDAVVLEFDFQASGDSIAFQYIFGSEEYPEFVNSFNDIFGFFISGPGFSGPYANNSENIALLPDGITVVSINNVNDGVNSQYYVDNSTDPYGASSVGFDGLTTTLTASANLQCGATYHIKIAIGDAADGSYDSGVFLKARSFSANSVNVQATNSAGVAVDSLMLEEGCTSAEIMFIRPIEYIDSAQTFQLNAVGTADTFDLAIYQDSVYFPIGVDSVLFTINPINDVIIEPMELFQIQVFSITSCGDTLYDSVRIYIVDPVYVDLTSTPATACNPDGSANAIAVGNIGTPIYSWTGPGPDNTDTVHTTAYNNIASGWYYMTLSDDQCTIKDSVFVDQLNPPIASFTSPTSSGSTPAAFTFINTSQNATNYLWDFGNTQTATVSTTASQNMIYTSSGTYTVTLIAYLGLCTDTATFEVTALDLPVVNPPNFFTPNGDGDNDSYMMNTSNVSNVELTITNRWGNIVFQASGTNPAWSGTTDNKELDAGVYFYMYTATGANGDELTGHGFLHLIRD